MSLIEIPALLERRKNGKVTSRVITSYIGRKFGIRFVMGKKSCSFWLIWHKTVAVNEWRAQVVPVSISKQCECLPVSASLTLASQSNTKFGTASKLGGHGDGLPSLCMNFVELELATMIASIGNNRCLG